MPLYLLFNWRVYIFRFDSPKDRSLLNQLTGLSLWDMTVLIVTVLCVNWYTDVLWCYFSLRDWSILVRFFNSWIFWGRQRRSDWFCMFWESIFQWLKIIFIASLNTRSLWCRIWLVSLNFFNWCKWRLNGSVLVLCFNTRERRGSH